jgi:3-methyladenine DNA glycosylase/8-oxoguanine DNA glycosylase
VFQIALEIPSPFHFQSVLYSHGWFQLVPFYWHTQSGTLFWATRFPNQTPVVLQVRPGEKKEKKTVLYISADIDITPYKDSFIQKCRHVFNLDLDLRPFYRICRKDPVLYNVISSGRGRLMRSESIYEDIFKSICGTNIQWKQAVKMINRIGQAGSRVPESDYRCFPTPQQILNKGEPFLKEQGRAGYRSRYLIELSRRFSDNEPKAVKAEKGELDAKALKNYFLSFSGIGKTTARYLMALYGHFEEIAVDSLVISYLSKTVFGGKQPNEKQIEAYFSPYGKWAYLAYWMQFILAGGWQPREE